MMMTITSNACPFKLIVEFPMETKSGYPTTTAKDEFLVKFMYWLARGGTANFRAWGKMI